MTEDGAEPDAVEFLSADSGPMQPVSVVDDSDMLLQSFYADNGSCQRKRKQEQ